MSCNSCRNHVCTCSDVPNAKEFIQMVLDADSEKLITQKLKPIEGKVNDVIQQNQNLVFINREVKQAITDINEVKEIKDELVTNLNTSTEAINNNTATINSLVAGVEKQVSDAILNSGYVVLDSFETGNTIYQRNEVLKHELTGKIYRWAGKIPKVVPTSSTPTSTGGIAANAWLEVSDTAFRQEILTGGLLTDTLVTATSNNGTVPRTQRDINAERVSIKSYGAIGDGTLHTVAEWTVAGSKIYYPNLAAIQVDYPHVTSLSDSIDWAATQKAVTNNVAIYCPKGSYVLSNSVKTPHYTNSRAVGFTGIDITGDGGQTLFTRNDKSECTRIYHSTTKFTTQESDTANQNEACFAVHTPHTRISNMTIADSKLGVYYGQDFAQPFTSLSSVTYSSLSNVGIRGCGTGVLFLAAGGNHYVDFYNVFFFGNQIDTHKRSSFWWGVTKGRGDNNNNRHNYYKVRSDSSRVGLWNECGDTTTTISWHGENCSSTTSNNSYLVPHGLPTDMFNAAGELKQSSVFIEGGSCQYNQYYGCMTESCEHHLYNAGYKNSYETCLMDASKSTFIRDPHIWSMRTGLSRAGIKYFSDTPATNIDKVHKVQGRLYLGDGLANGVAVVSNTYRHAPTSNLNNSESIKYQIEFGAVPKETELVIDIWPDTNADTNKIGNINIDVVSRCTTTGQNSSFSAKATISAMKAPRSVTHYSMHVVHSFRSWYNRHLVNVYETTPGEPAGEGEPDNPDVVTEVVSQAMRLSIRQDPTNPWILQLVITCPWDLSGGTIFVERQTQNLNS